MRIVFHAWRDLAHPQAGGSERLVDWIAAGLAERGHSVVLCAGSPVEPRRYEVLPSGGRFGHYLRMPFVHRRAVRDDKADVIVDVVSGMTYFSPWWQRTPTVLLHTHVHTEQWRAMFPAPVAWFGQRIESRLIPACYRKSLIVTISDSSADGLAELGVGRDRLRVLPVPTDAVPVEAERSAEPLFVAVGRLVPYKQFDVLIDIWRAVQAEIGGRLVIVGSGPDRDALAAKAGPGVELVGFVSDEERMLLQRQAWLEVHTASHEGWGIIITEAGAQSTPTLAFRVPGVQDAIRDGVSGVLVDDVEQFAAQWVALARDPQRRDELGRGARAMADEHTVAACVDAFEAFLVEAVRR